LARAAQKPLPKAKVAMFIVFNVDITYYGDDPQAGFAMIRKNGAAQLANAWVLFLVHAKP
jgi:hypothetical protein